MHLLWHTKECHILYRHLNVSSFFCEIHILEIILFSLHLLELSGSNLQVDLLNSVIYFEKEGKTKLICYVAHILGNCAVSLLQEI